MLQVEWRDDYRIDDGKIDQEHQQLIEIANRVFAVTDPTAEREQIVELVQSLYRYMECHFLHEEELMHRIGYPDRVEHARRHRRIIDQMNRTLRSQSDLESYVSRLRHLVVDWVISHIVDEDRKIADYMKGEDKLGAVTVGSTK